MEINFFDKYVLRVPILSLDNLEKINTKSIIKKFEQSELIQEALFLSSPELYYEIKKSIESDDIDEKKVLALSKFLIRASTKCTPFGLFAGVSIGNLIKTDLKKIEIGDLSKYKRVSNFDMKFLCQLYEFIMSDSESRYKMTFTTNNSIYQVGEKYRYVEYRYVEGNKSHYISSITYSKYLEKVFEYCENGMKFENLINEIFKFDNTLSQTEIRGFVNELIDNQLIVSEIYPTVIGNDYFESLSRYVPNSEKLKTILNKINNNFIDAENINLYHQIYSELDKMNIGYDRKFIFKTDLLTGVDSNSLNISIANNIRDAIRLVLINVNIHDKNDRLENFKNKFYNRYEENEVPISLALDTELGIAYEESYSYEKSYLTQDVIYTQEKSEELEKQTKFDDFIKDSFKLDNYLAKSNYEIILDEIPFMSGDEENKIMSLLPKTFSIFSSIYTNKDEEPIIVIDGIGGDSASSLLGRFSHLNNDLYSFIKEISNKEDDLYKDAIFAEIVHLPDDRSGNISYRKKIRNFEIPYLSSGSVEEENQILMKDILLSLRGDKFVLRSKKHNKVIKPILSTAQDYNLNSLPIYKFLCDMQSQDNIRSFKFGKSIIKNQIFYPRLKYKNIILSLAQWHFQQKVLLKCITNNFNKFKKDLKIPDIIIFSTNSDDSYLILDLNNTIHLNVFFDEIRKRKDNMIILKEYLNLKPITNRGNYSFNNEFVFSAFIE